MSTAAPLRWHRSSHHVRYIAPCGTCGHLARCDEWELIAMLPDGAGVTSLELVVRCLICELGRR